MSAEVAQPPPPAPAETEDVAPGEEAAQEKKDAAPAAPATEAAAPDAPHFNPQGPRGFMPYDMSFMPPEAWGQMVQNMGPPGEGGAPPQGQMIPGQYPFGALGMPFNMMQAPFRGGVPPYVPPSDAAALQYFSNFMAGPFPNHIEASCEGCSTKSLVLLASLREDGSWRCPKCTPATSLTAPSSQRRRGYWSDFKNVEMELRDFLGRAADKIEPGRMPTQKEMREGGVSGSLKDAIRMHGGTAVVAERMGLRSTCPKPKEGQRRRPRGFWQDFANVERETRQVLADKGISGRLPTISELKEAGRLALGHAFYVHGGPQAVAERMGLVRVKSTSAPYIAALHAPIGDLPATSSEGAAAADSGAASTAGTAAAAASSAAGSAAGAYTLGTLTPSVQGQSANLFANFAPGMRPNGFPELALFGMGAGSGQWQPPAGMSFSPQDQLQMMQLQLQHQQMMQQQAALSAAAVASSSPGANSTAAGSLSLPHTFLPANPEAEPTAGSKRSADEIEDADLALQREVKPRSEADAAAAAAAAAEVDAEAAAAAAIAAAAAAAPDGGGVGWPGVVLSETEGTSAT